MVMLKGGHERLTSGTVCCTSGRVLGRPIGFRCFSSFLDQYQAILVVANGGLGRPAWHSPLK